MGSDTEPKENSELERRFPQRPSAAPCAGTTNPNGETSQPEFLEAAMRTLALLTALLGLSPALSTAQNGIATLLPTSLSFPGQLLGTTSASKTAVLTNSGTGALAINSIVSSGNFASSHNCPISPSTLAVGAKCTITATFKPSVPSGISGEISIFDNAIGSPHLVNLSGIGLTAISLSPATLAFGTISAGTTSAAKTVTLTNNLSTALTIGFSASGDYAAVGGGTTPCGTSLAGKAKQLGRKARARL